MNELHVHNASRIGIPMNLARFDLISIRLVVLCAERGSLAAVAKLAHMSKSAASHRLANLELCFGQQLFHRDHRRATPHRSRGRLRRARPIHSQRSTTARVATRLPENHILTRCRYQVHVEYAVQLTSLAGLQRMPRLQDQAILPVLFAFARRSRVFTIHSRHQSTAKNETLKDTS